MRKFFQNFFAAVEKIKLLETQLDFFQRQIERLEGEKRELAKDNKRLEKRFVDEIKANREREDELQAIIVAQAAGNQRLSNRDKNRAAVDRPVGSETDDEAEVITIGDFEYTNDELHERAVEIFEQAQQRGDKYSFDDLIAKMRENPQIYLQN